MDKWIQFIKAHERLILVLVGLVILYIGYSKWVSHKDQTDHDRMVVAHEQVQVDGQAALQAAGQVQQLTQANARLQQKIDLLQSEVTDAISNRDTQTKDRITHESTEPLGELATRWTTLVKAPTGTITPSGSSILVSDVGSRLTTEALERGNTAESDYSDLQKLDAGKDEQIRSLNQLVDSETNSARAQQVLLAAQLADYKTNLQVAKDDGKKNGRKSFWRGLAIGAGAVAAVALRFL